MPTPNMVNVIDDIEYVARAIFAPAMIDRTGNLSAATFSLRHNEGYFSVARMSIAEWIDDIKGIPETPERRLDGYCKMNVGEIRKQNIIVREDKVSLDVIDKATPGNRSHAGITISIKCKQLKGDRTLILKPLETGMVASIIMAKVQSRLTELASREYVRLPSIYNNEQTFFNS